MNQQAVQYFENELKKLRHRVVSLEARLTALEEANGVADVPEQPVETKAKKAKKKDA